MPTPWPIGVDRLILEETDSTNDFVANHAKSGGGSIWVLAQKQVASRGRRGRAWAFEEGNFAASYLVWPQNPIQEIAQMSFVAALALFETVQQLGGRDLSLKWPNDVLLGGKKLSGILLETVERSGVVGLVVGIGVNLRNAPYQSELEEHALPATSLFQSTDEIIDPVAFLECLAPNMAKWQGVWNQDGFPTIREAWLSRATGLGTKITARLPNVTHQGIFEDIDPNGALMLRTSSEVLVFPAADIYFAPDAQA